MAEYAPRAILDLSDQIVHRIPSAQLSGVVGDSAHTYGYHRARNYLPSSDYSVQLQDDKLGDGEAASALDISYSPVQIKIVTGRLIESADDANDPRLDYCREFYGTVDGQNVVGRDTYYGTPSTSDDSHLWHVHISFLRRYANDTAAMRAVLSVIVGETYAQYLAGGGATSGGSGMAVEFDTTDPRFGNGKENLYSVYRILLSLLDGRENVDNLHWVGNRSSQANLLHSKLNQLLARPGFALDEAAISAIAQRVAASLADSLAERVADELAQRLGKPTSREQGDRE